MLAKYNRYFSPYFATFCLPPNRDEEVFDEPISVIIDSSSYEEVVSEPISVLPTPQFVENYEDYDFYEDESYYEQYENSTCGFAFAIIT